MKPLLGCVRAAALSAGADGDGGQSDGERDVCVGGGAIEMRADAEVRINGADAVEDARVFGQASAWARADFLNLGGDLAAGGSIVFEFESALDAGRKQIRDFFELGGAF